MSPTNEEDAFVPEEDFDCPCGKHVYFGKMVGDRECLVHEMPHCDDFMNKDPIEYASWLRKKLEVELASEEPKLGRTIPGFFAPLVMACDECGEPATFDPGSKVKDCTCMEPEGMHVVRRCPAGHDNVSHIEIGAIDGNVESLAGGDSIVRATIDKGTHSILKQIAKERGGSPDDIARDLVLDAVGQEKCIRCGHRMKRHGNRETGDPAKRSAAGVPESAGDGACRAPGCECQSGVLRNEDYNRAIQKKASSTKEAAWLGAAMLRLDGSPPAVKEKFIEAMKAAKGSPRLKSLSLEEARKAVGKRTPFEAYLWDAGFRRASEIFRESLVGVESVSPRDFDAVLGSACVGSFLLGSESEQIESDSSAEGYLTIQLLSMMRLLWAGEREFRLSPPIAESLLLTEVKGVSLSDLRLPYDAFLMRFPLGLIDAASADGAVYPMTSAIVAEWDVSHGFWHKGAGGTGEGEKKRAVTVFGMCGFNGESKSVADTTSIGWMSLLEGDEIHILGLQNFTAGDPAKRRDDPLLKSFETNAQAIKLATRLALNTCLYVSLPNSDVVLDGQDTLARLRERVRKHPKGSRKRDRVSAELRELEKKPEVRKVGWSIKVPASVREAAAHERSAKGRRFTAQWLVRGHWRNQAVGDRVVGQHKLIWIQPYHCRRDLGERLKQAPYSVR